MLSTSVIKNVTDAGHYYSKEDNYYTKDQGIEQSEWWGDGAKKLGVTGVVDHKKFTDLLNGYLPNGDKLGKLVDGQMKHRPGWDLTFSAPKSVSILALIGGDKRLIEAHQKAVVSALRHVERACAEVRQQSSNEMSYKNTKNLVAALFHHDLSRSKDPQLHTHSVVMNMTARADGKWRSLASKIGRYDETTTNEVNGFIERVRHHKRYFSKMYEAELAFNIKQLGYGIRTYTKTGIFEIVGVTEEAIQFFSKRRQDIEKKLTEKGMSGGKAAAFATLDKRPEKEEVNRALLKEKWEEDSKKLNLNFETIIGKAQKQVQELDIKQDNHIDDRLFDAIRHASRSLSYFQSTFTLEDLLINASEYAIQKGTMMDALLTVTEKLKEQGELVSLHNEQGKALLMTKETMDEEKRLFSLLDNDKKVEMLVSQKLIKSSLHSHNQQEHAKDIETIFGNDPVVMIEGEYTQRTLINPVVQISRRAKINIAVLSPNLISSKQFSNRLKYKPTSILDKLKNVFIDSKPKHYSVMQFLSQFNMSESKAETPKILIVENANLLSTHQQVQLFEFNKAHNSKLIMLGNEQTLTSQALGVPISTLTERGLPTIKITEPLDITDNHFKPNNIKPTINKILEKTVEVVNEEDRHHAMAKHFCRLKETDRKKSWLVSFNKQNVEKLNLRTHLSLIENGHLGKGIKVKSLIPVYIQEGKGTLASNYQKNQIVRFNESYSTLNVNRGEYLKVVRHSRTSNRVVLLKDNGRHVIWRPDQVAGASSNKIELFNEVEREFLSNELIIAKRSLKYKGIVKGERFSISSVNKNNMKLKNIDGKSIIIDLNKPFHRHFDYGYAETAYGITHEQPRILISELKAKSYQTNQRLLIQFVTQTNEPWFYTDNQLSLLDNLENNTGDKLTVSEILKKAEETKASIKSFYKVLESQILKKLTTTNSDAIRKAIDAVDYAAKHLAEREAGFAHKELMVNAMQYGIGDLNDELISQVVLEMEKAGILIRGKRNDGTLWTSLKAVKMEKELLVISKRDQGKFEPIISDISQDKHLVNLKPEQVNAIKAITQSTDRVLSIEGRAGTGKTTMMVTLADVVATKDTLTDHGYSVACVAPTHKAVKELQVRGLNAQTVDSFLWDWQKGNPKESHNFTKTILIIDESSMLSNRKMLALLQLGHDLNFRSIILTGDSDQNPAIEAGKPHDLIQRKLDTTITLEDMQRQKNEVLKEAVKAIYQKNVGKTFAVLDDKVIEISEKISNDSDDKVLKPDEIQAKYYKKRIQTIASNYVSLLRKGENVQIISPGHAERTAINEEVRKQLEDLNILKGEKKSFSVLAAESMTAVEKSKAQNFRVGQIIRFTAGSGQHIKAGDYFTITNRDIERNSLTLKDVSGKELIWSVAASSKRQNNFVEVFKVNKRTLQIGDKIIWTRTNKQEGILATYTSKVINIDSNIVSLKQHDGSIFTFDASDNKYQHWDHAYAITTYGSQGGTYSTVLALFESYRHKLINFKTLLVTITRPENELRIYTNDKKGLIEAIKNNRGDKTSSLEVIGEYPNTKRSQRTKIDLPERSIKTAKDINVTAPKFDRYSVEKIREGLNKDAGEIAVNILGNPKEKGSNYLRFGSNKGSLIVTIKGQKQGWFNDFETNQGGRDMLKFLQIHGGMSREAALDFGASRLGLRFNNEAQNRKLSKKNPSKKDNVIKQKPHEIFSAYERRRIKLANKIATESLTIKGTLAEKYLRDHREIAIENDISDIRFHPNLYSQKNGKSLPALIAVARDKEGKIQAVEAIYLDPITANKADVSLPKQTIGPKKGAAVFINQVTNSEVHTLIAEGVVTGLSLAKALPKTNVRITLGKQMFSSINPDILSKKVVFCLDNDGKNLRDDNQIYQAADRLKSFNKDVNFMIPTALDAKNQDYSDILKVKGESGIQDDFARQISYDSFYKNNPKIDNINTKNLLPSAKNASHKEQSYLNAYHQISSENLRNEVNKTVTKIKNIDREI